MIAVIIFMKTQIEHVKTVSLIVNSVITPLFVLCAIKLIQLTLLEIVFCVIQ